VRRAVLALLLAAGSLDCASSSSELQSIPVITDPSGAIATTNTQKITTPGSLLVPAGAREIEIRIELDGYEPQTVLLTHPEAGAFTQCLDRATSGRQGGSRRGQIQGPGSGLAIIGSALVRAAVGCARETDLLVPGFVFVKLVAADLPPLPAGRSIARR
jgi:hypothetical protein